MPGSSARVSSRPSMVGPSGPNATWPPRSWWAHSTVGQPGATPSIPARGAWSFRASDSSPRDTGGFCAVASRARASRPKRSSRPSTAGDLADGLGGPSRTKVTARRRRPRRLRVRARHLLPSRWTRVAVDGTGILIFHRRRRSLLETHGRYHGSRCQGARRRLVHVGLERVRAALGFRAWRLLAPAHGRRWREMGASLLRAARLRHARLRCPAGGGWPCRRRTER